MPLTVHALDHIVINVKDVEASARWYEAVLGVEREDFDPGHGKPRRTSIKFGQQKINLRPITSDVGEWFTGICPTSGSDDICFLTSSVPNEVVDHLRQKAVVIEEGPVAKQGARGRLCSVYCRDLDGNLIEIASYSEANLF